DPVLSEEGAQAWQRLPFLQQSAGSRSLPAGDETRPGGEPGAGAAAGIGRRSPLTLTPLLRSAKEHACLPPPKRLNRFNHMVRSEPPVRRGTIRESNRVIRKEGIEHGTSVSAGEALPSHGWPGD